APGAVGRRRGRARRRPLLGPAGAGGRRPRVPARRRGRLSRPAHGRRHERRPCRRSQAGGPARVRSRGTGARLRALGGGAVAAACARRAPGAAADRLVRRGAPRAPAAAEASGHAEPPARGQRRHPEPVVALAPRLGHAGRSLMGSAFRSIATAVPEHRLEAADALRALRAYWPRLDRLEDGDAALGTRYTCEPLEKLVAHRSLTDLRAAYLRHAGALAEAAARDALDQAHVAGSDVDLVITVSCTGYVVPSLDVHLAGALGLRPDVIRLPITELGCSGGAAAIAAAHRHLAGFPDDVVLVVAVEVPSLSFQPEDPSLDNLTACLVFGDGAGAAVLARLRPARQRVPRGPRSPPAACALVGRPAGGRPLHGRRRGAGAFVLCRARCGPADLQRARVRARAPAARVRRLAARVRSRGQHIVGGDLLRAERHRRRGDPRARARDRRRTGRHARAHAPRVGAGGCYERGRGGGIHTVWRLKKKPLPRAMSTCEGVRGRGAWFLGGQLRDRRRL